MENDPLVNRILDGGFLGSSDLSAGKRPDATGERYEVLERLGGGAFGTVYRAHDHAMNRVVALKRIAFQPGKDLRRSTLEREVNALVHLRHDAIPTAYDAVWRADGVDVIMELVPGTPLEDAIEARSFSRVQLLTIVEDVARAVHYAHGQGFVHRDLKPSDILGTP